MKGPARLPASGSRSTIPPARPTETKAPPTQSPVALGLRPNIKDVTKGGIRVTQKGTGVKETMPTCTILHHLTLKREPPPSSPPPRIPLPGQLGRY